MIPDKGGSCGINRACNNAKVLSRLPGQDKGQGSLIYVCFTTLTIDYDDITRCRFMAV